MGLFNKNNNIAYCGMVGFSGKNVFDVDKIKILMLGNMTRGMHSTGIYNGGHVTKDSVDAVELLAKVELIPELIFMGHDRYATVGNKTAAKNAHPFRYGNTIGQHNGTLKNHYAMIRENDLEYVDYDVDSQVLIKLLDTDSSFKVLQEFEGAAALIWTNVQNPKRIYCFRNVDRPLYRGMIGEDMYISSIEDTLTLIGCKTIKLFKENYLYTIEDGKIISTGCKRVIRKAKKHTNNISKYTGPTNHNSQLSNVSKNSSLLSKSADIKTGNLDLMSRWVKRTSESTALKTFIKDKWYFVKDVTTDNFLLILNENNTPVRCVRPDFSQFVPLPPGRYVSVIRPDKNNVLKAGEIMYLRGVEMSKCNTYTVAALEKLDADNKSYDWPKDNIRLASDEEVQDYMFANSDSAEIEFPVSNDNDDDAVLMQEFENSPDYMDVDGNRLGVSWIQVESIYESFITIRHDADKIADELSILYGYTDDDSIIDIIDKQRSELSSIYDIAENELDKIFFPLYQDHIGE